MGWYQGTGARLVWSSATLRGRVQPACRLTRGINMVSCDDWHESFHVTLPRTFVQGDYLFKLVGGGTAQA